MITKISTEYKITADARSSILKTYLILSVLTICVIGAVKVLRCEHPKRAVPSKLAEVIDYPEIK